MKKIHARSLGVLLPWLSLACQGAVEEPQQAHLSLQGEVQLGASADLEARLVFFGEDYAYLVRGESHRGPNSFRVDVSGPPPEGALADLSTGGQMAWGTLVMAPSSMRQRLPNLYHGGTEISCDDSNSCTWIEDMCSDDQCRQREYQCRFEACEVIGTRGPAPDPNDAPWSVDPACFGEVCFTALEYPAAPGELQTTQYTRCSTADLGLYDVLDDGGIQRCELVNETGATSLVSVEELLTAEDTLTVIYLTEDLETGYGKLTQGYTVLERLAPTQQEWLKRASAPECSSETACDLAFDDRTPILHTASSTIDLGPVALVPGRF